MITIVQEGSKWVASDGENHVEGDNQTDAYFNLIKETTINNSKSKNKIWTVGKFIISFETKWPVWNKQKPDGPIYYILHFSMDVGTQKHISLIFGPIRLIIGYY